MAHLDDELKLVRHGTVIESFRVAVTDVVRLFTLPQAREDEEEEGRCAALLGLLYEEINRHTICDGDSEALAAQTARECMAAVRLWTPATEELDAGRRNAAAVRLPGSARYRDAGAGGRLIRRLPRPGLGNWALIGLLPRWWRATCRRWKLRRICALLRLMLRWQRFFEDWRTRPPLPGWRSCVPDGGARAFIGVHTYQEHEWFAKERFELLMERLFLVEEIRIAASAEVIPPLRPLLRQDLHDLLTIAAGAGYRLDRFLALVQEKSSAPGTGEN